MYDVIIIGKGPAGISASLYTTRAKLCTLVIGGTSWVEKSHKIENYYGFPGGVGGTELIKLGHQQAEKLGAKILDDTVVSIEWNKTFKVITKECEYEAKAVILATGQTLNKLKIPNADRLEGKGIHYCVTCDGFFYNGLKVGILGYTDYAVHEAVELTHFSKNITIYTNGKELEISPASKVKITQNNIKIENRPVAKFEGENSLQNIVFADGTIEKIDGIFVAYGSAGSTDFARKLGVITNKDAIIVDKDQKTNVPGLYAAGDCTGGFKQVSVAVGQGAIAGQKIVEYIRSL